MFIQNSYRFGGAVATLLLDTYTGAVAAYSLRKLKTGVTNVVRVRRSSDNTEQNFTATDITDGTLTTFTGSNDGFVTIWYDQTGNINVVQATANNQPQLVNNGVVILDNGKPTVFYGLNSTASIKSLGTSSQYIIAQPTNYFSVARLNTDNASFLFDRRTNSSSERQSFLEGFGSIGVDMSAGNTLTLTSNPSLKTTLYEALFNSTNSKGYMDSVQMVAGDSGLLSQDWGQLGASEVSNFQSRSVSELIIYPSDQTTNRIGINANLNAEYKIFPDTAISGLLFDYPNASAAYSLRQLTFYQNGYIPDLVTIRRSSDNIEQDFNETEITDGTLASFCSSTDGFVLAWYDQSSNNNHAVQSTTADQPKLVSNGVVILENGKPAIDFNGSNSLNTLNSNTTQSIFVVCKDTNLNANAAEYVIGSDQNNSGIRTSGTAISGIGVRTGTVSINSTVEDTNQHLITIDINAATVRVDASVEATGVMVAFTYNIIGLRNSGALLPFSGLVQEVISYNINQTTNVTAIETNINTEYSIY